ncbi:MAG: formate dehydrogenase accessory protein FdhE [Deltaproteobacteria bacterium]|nr:formate dehydrogenase accessory protein FdhE [Deltaproteobacteria bacterium]
MTTEAIRHDHTQASGTLPFLRFPDPARLFLERSRRFAALAEGHSLADWLLFLGRLTLAQHELLQAYPSLPLPDEAALSFFRNHGLPPISATAWPRDPCWREALNSLAQTLMAHAPSPAQETLKRIRTMDGAALEAIADQVLRGEFGGPDRDSIPFVAAALQVHWTSLAVELDPRAVAPLDTPGLCPCCGFLPVAGIVRMDGEIAKLRYLHCGLCNTEWHLERVTCAACREGNRIAYRYLDGCDGTVRAETCDGCKRYLKILYREKAPEADPVADDLATLALDLLVDEAGYDRMSPNLLFVP